MVRILIKGGKVVNDDCTQEADVYIENGIIQQVGKEMMIPGGAKVIDATGKLVLPGGIDTSVHLDEYFMNATTADDYYSGTKVKSCWKCKDMFSRILFYNFDFTEYTFHSDTAQDHKCVLLTMFLACDKFI